MEDVAKYVLGASAASGTRVGIDVALIEATAKFAALRAQPGITSEDLLAQAGAGLSVEAQASWQCVVHAYRYFDAKSKGDEAAAAAAKADFDFSACDPAWFEAIESYLEYFGPDGKRATIPYIRHRQLEDFVLPTLKPDAKIAIIGDWGTGTATASAVLRQLAALAPDVVIHLGDIYYSGTPAECQSYFLGMMNTALDRTHKAIPLYTLSGNHDMYCGGLGYYGMLPQLNPPPCGPEDAQPASYLALRTSDGRWQLLIMDTGLNDFDPFTVSDVVTSLDPGEEAWHLDKIANFPGGTILLSHHQLFSAFSQIGPAAGGVRNPLNPKLKASLDRFQAARPIAAWFWGHEHNMCVYQPYAGLERGRCIGHGSIPVYDTQSPYAALDGVADAPKLVQIGASPGQPLMLGAANGIYAHGFVMLTPNPGDGTMRADYYDDVAGPTPRFNEVIAP
jgi:hypothetical protein